MEITITISVENCKNFKHWTHCNVRAVNLSYLVKVMAKSFPARTNDEVIVVLMSQSTLILSIFWHWKSTLSVVFLMDRVFKIRVMKKFLLISSFNDSKHYDVKVPI